MWGQAPVKSENQNSKILNTEYKQSFTLVELMIVIAILAILSAIVIFVLNPARLFDNFRDSQRISDITTIHKSIAFLETWNISGLNYGSTTTVYISVPDSDPGCANIVGLPTLSSGYNYACSSETNYKKSDGTGWLPVNFLVNGSNYYLSLLPVDPTNDNEFFYAYFPGGSYELLAKLKNYASSNSVSESDNADFFIIGSPNRVNHVPMTALLSGPEPLIHDGYTYDTFELPSGVIWMKDNMRSSTLQAICDGGRNCTTCCYDNNSANCDTYGRLYTHSAAWRICPTGWTLPTDDDWKELEGYFNMSVADQNANGWRGTGLRDAFVNNFDVVMSGYMLQFCGSHPTNFGMGEGTAFWTATASANGWTYPYNRSFRSDLTTIGRAYSAYYVDYLHVRCVKKPT